MSEAVLLLEIDSLELALKAARAYRTSLVRLQLNETKQHLQAAAEAQVQALQERLRCVRYLLHHPAEVRA